jgi:hypothetical protein
MYLLIGGLFVTNLLPINYLLSFSIQAMQLAFILFDFEKKLDEST